MDQPEKTTPDGQLDKEDQDLLFKESRKAKFEHTAHFSRYIIGVVCLLIIVLFLIGIIPHLILENQLEKQAAQVKILRVEIMTVKGINKPIPLTLPSSIDAINITPIWARVNGYIKTFFADIGDIVKAGAVLAEIETPELDQERDQALADLAKAMAQQSIAKITADRWVQLHKDDPEAISKQDVDQRNADLEAASAEVLAAEANVGRLEKTLEFKQIIAPFDGIIIERDIDIGTLITLGRANKEPQLYKIARTDILRVFVDVPQRYFRLIKEGVKADVVISEFPEKVFKGFVARYAKALDTTARTMLTEVHIPNHDNQLFVGLYADVNFLLQPINTYFQIPTNALIIQDEGSKVAVVDADNIIHIKSVKLGLDHGKMMDIITGLSENENIVLTPNDQIKEGVRVEPITNKVKE